VRRAPVSPGLALVVALTFAVPSIAADEVALVDPSPAAQRARSTLQDMRDRRDAADAERGGTFADLKEQWDAQAAADQAAAAQRAQQSTSKRRRRGGFFVFTMIREALQAGREIAGAARDLKDRVQRTLPRPVEKILDGVDRVQGWAVEQVKRPLRPVFDRTGLLGEVLEMAADVKAGDYVHGRIRNTKVGEAIERLRRGQARLDDRFVEWTDHLDRVEGQLADAEALIDFLSGIKDPRVREALEGYVEERLGVPLSDIAIGLGGRGTARDNVRTGVQGAHGRPGGMPPGMPPGGMEGRGRPPMPRGGRAEGTGRGRMGMPPR